MRSRAPSLCSPLFLSRLLRALPPIAAVKSFRSCLMLVFQISIILSKVFLAKMLSFSSPSICLPSISCSKACARGVGIEWVVPSAANFPWLYFPAWGVLETHNCKWALLKEEIYMYMYMYVYMYQVLKPEIVCNILSVETATTYENILQQKH